MVELDEDETIRETSNWLKYRSCIGVCGFAIFASLSITIGVLTVCLTSPRNTNATCQLTFKRSAHREIGYDSRPVHLAVGDFNNDAKQDIAVANSGTNNVGIFLGYGNGSFTIQITYSTGFMSHPYSVGIGDFNNDTLLDIVVANYGTNSIGVLLGDGNGTFSSPIITSLGSHRPRSLIIRDFNKDNQLDIAIVNYGTSTVAVLTGCNNGSFRIATIYNMGYDSIPYSLAVANFNNDTQLDIAVINYGTSTLAILLANENGTFTSQQYSTGNGSHPCSIAIGDFNNDYQLDIAIANSGTSDVSIFRGYGNGSFINIATHSTGPSARPQFIIVIDFNNDTILDIVIVRSEDNNVLVLKGDGTGTFSLITTQSIGSNSDPCSIAAADFDNDNKLDIAITNNSTNSIVVLTTYAVYPNVHMTTYSTGESSAPSFVAVGDFNNDNHLDFVVANSAINSVVIFINSGDATFTSEGVYYTENGSKEQYVSLGDYNNDHRLDIAVLMSGVNKLRILLGYGNGTFEYGEIYSTGAQLSSSSITVGDLNKDNYLDIIVANSEAGNLVIFLGYGDGTFTNFTIYLTRYGVMPVFVHIDDFNSDNISDIVTTDFKNSTIMILLGYGNGSFLISMIIFTNNDNPIGVAVGDLNNDHRLDIVYISPITSTIGVILGSVNGTFQSINRYFAASGSLTSSVALGDFNKDSILDITVSNFFDYNIGMFLGFGNGSFAAQKTFITGLVAPPFFLATGDFNNNKQSDIVVANLLSNTVGVLIVYDDANFASTTSYKTGSGPHPSSVVMGDFNNDNQSDIAVANPGNDNIQILIDYNKGSFVNKVTYSTGFNSHPKFVTIADFDNDKQLDVAVASSWNNAINIFLGFGNGTFKAATTYSTSSGSLPSSIAISNFNNDSWLDIVVANPGTDNIAVFLSFNYVTFTNYTMYVPGMFPAPKYVIGGDFNNDHKCDIVVVNENSAEIQVHLGYENGTFARSLSFSTGTSSSPSSSAAGDFNNDHQLDIVVANTGTNNIGIFIGYGNGSFRTQMKYNTGNSSAPVSVAIGDFNNDNISDIVVANNGTDNIGIFLGYENGTFSTQVSYYMSSGSSPVWVAIDDFDNNNILDIVVVNMKADNIRILFGYGNGTFADGLTFSTGDNSNPCSVAVGDFNKDGWMDIAVASQNSKAIVVFSHDANTSSFSKSSYWPYLVSFFQSIFVEDVNNDTKLDILVTGVGLDIGVIYILYGFGDGNFSTPTVYSSGIREFPTSIAICDFDNDGRLDLAITNYAKQNIFFLFQSGSEQFATPWFFSTGIRSQPTSVAVGDFNHDKYIDVAVANFGTNNIGIFLGVGDGTLSQQKTYTTGNNSTPVSIAIHHINEDDQLDIVVANSNTNNIGILFGYKNGSFALIRTYSTGISSAPSSIAINDLNKDSFMDIVVVNFGTNKILIFFGLGNQTFLDPKSYSLEYNARPQSVTIGDINNDNLLDIIVTNSGTDYVEILLQTC